MTKQPWKTAAAGLRHFLEKGESFESLFVEKKCCLASPKGSGFEKKDVVWLSYFLETSPTGSSCSLRLLYFSSPPEGVFWKKCCLAFTYFLETSPTGSSSPLRLCTSFFSQRVLRNVTWLYIVLTFWRQAPQVPLGHWGCTSGSPPGGWSSPPETGNWTCLCCIPSMRTGSCTHNATRPLTSKTQLCEKKERLATYQRTKDIVLEKNILGQGSAPWTFPVRNCIMRIAKCQQQGTQWRHETGSQEKFRSKLQNGFNLHIANRPASFEENCTTQRSLLTKANVCHCGHIWFSYGAKSMRKTEPYLWCWWSIVFPPSACRLGTFSLQSEEQTNTITHLRETLKIRKFNI